MPHALRSGTAWDRKRADYAYARELSGPEWAWEFLRRNYIYQYDRRMNRAGYPVAIRHISGATLFRPRRRFLAAEAWGLELFADPQKTAKETDVFWLPALLTHVVTCQCRAMNDNECAGLSLPSFQGRRAVLAGFREEHVAISKGGESATLVIEKGTFLFGNATVRFMHDGLCSTSNHLATTHILKYFTVGKATPIPKMTYSEGKLMNYLIALDGHLEGRTFREIAIALYGPEAVESSWSGGTSWMKSNVRRAVANGKELMNGGYRKLL